MISETGRLVVGWALATSLCSSAVAQELCPIQTDCSSQGALAIKRISQVYEDSTGEVDLPFGFGAPTTLTVPKFDRAAAAALEGGGVTEADITLAGVELQLEIVATEITVRADSTAPVPCAIDWSYNLFAEIQSNPELQTRALVIAPIQLADSTVLPPASGGPPPPWDYEWQLTVDGGGSILQDNCEADATPSTAWVSTPGNTTASFDVLSSVEYTYNDPFCTNSLNEIDDMGIATVRVRYHYCVAQVNEPPVCDAGPPQTLECTGAPLQVQLDGTGSLDPDGGPLQYLWSASCPGASFDDVTSPTPVLTLDVGAEGCDYTCLVELQVTDSAIRSSQCSTMISVRDTTPPTIACEQELTVVCGFSDPVFTGTPVVFDLCDPNPVLSYVESTIYVADCETDRLGSILTRRWTATDACGNRASCIQVISILRRNLPLDAIPGSCPNEYRNEECGEEDVCASNSKPSILTMVYTGDDCGASVTTQSPSFWDCEGDPNDAPLVRILATNKINGANIYTWFDGMVALNDTYQIDAANAGKAWLQANVHIRIYDLDDNLLQHTYFHSSCSQPLAVGDQFGANLIVGFVTQDGEVGGTEGGGGTGGGLEDLVVTIPGSATFDVTSIDLGTTRLWGKDCSIGGIVPASSTLEDVASPTEVLCCSPCTSVGPDGFMDLSFTIDAQELRDAFGLAGQPAGTRVLLMFTGKLQDGCEFIAPDCFVLTPCVPGSGD